MNSFGILHVDSSPERGFSKRDLLKTSTSKMQEFEEMNMEETEVSSQTIKQSTAQLLRSRNTLTCGVELEESAAMTELSKKLLP